MAGVFLSPASFFHPFSIGNFSLLSPSSYSSFSHIPNFLPALFNFSSVFSSGLISFYSFFSALLSYQCLLPFIPILVYPTTFNSFHSVSPRYLFLSSPASFHSYSSRIFPLLSFPFIISLLALPSSDHVSSHSFSLPSQNERRVTSNNKIIGRT